MLSGSTPPSVLGHRLRSRREALGWSQEKVGILIGLDESSSRARISRYELGVHEPPIATARLLAAALDVPLPFLYCDDDEVAELLLVLFRLTGSVRKERAKFFQQSLGKIQQ